jgi:hypothetical protein
MRNLHTMTRGAAGIVAFAGAMQLLAACGSDDGSGSDRGPSPPKDNTPTVETIVAPENDLAPLDHEPSFEPDYNNLTPQPWVEPTTATQTDGVDVHPDRLVFPDTMTEIADWEPGRLVVSGPGKGSGKNPWGFARRVVKVEHVASQFVVTTSVAAIEDVLQGDFQMQLKPESLSEVDLTKADLQWAADNLYFQSENADLIELNPLDEDWPDGAEPLGFWKKVKKKVGGAAKALAQGAVDAYKKVTPDTVSGSVKLSPTLTLADQSSLFAFYYVKDFQAKKVPYSISLSGAGSYDASVTLKPGVQVGAKIAFPGKGAKSSYWVNVDASMALKLGFDFDLAAALTYNGKSGEKLADELENDAVVAQLLLGEERKKLFGDPDMRPMGGWKKTLWISKPMSQTFAAGPVPVVMVETVQIDMECGFMAKASLSGQLTFEQNATFKFSVKSDQPAQPPTFTKTKKTDIQITGGGELSVYCGLIPRVNVFFYDTVGLFAGVRGSLVASGKYASVCKQKPKEWWPDGELTLGLYGNVGLRVGARVQAPGSSWLGKAGQKLGVEADLEPWNMQFPLLEKKWTFPVGFGYCTPTCQNQAKDGDETDADCGGPNCNPCKLGASCKLNSDCADSACVQGKCSADQCGDAVEDGAETDVDCGGPSCAKCGVGKGCSLGSDCESGYCSAWTTDPPVCVADHCSDGVKDGDEGGLDCGGTTCAKCAVGKEASSAGDCESGAFNGTICVASDCYDLAKSGVETDVDCGGATCPGRCGLTQACKQTSDCAKGLACHPTLNVCLRSIGQGCAAGSDCLTNVCQNGTCGSAASQCANGVQDGAETDADCGGPDCAKCAALQQCMVPSDCVFGGCQLVSGGVGGACTKPATLLAAWQFDGNGYDSSGNGHTATLGSGVSYTSQSHSGSGAAAFDGSGSATVGTIIVGDKFTIASWVYAPSPVLANSNTLISSAASFVYPYDGLTFHFNSPETSDLALGFETGNGTNMCNLISTAAVVKAGGWRHLAVTADRTAGTATFYVDGAPVGSSGCLSTTFTTGLPLVLGRLAQALPLKGTLDDFRIYGSVLSASEVAALAQL